MTSYCYPLPDPEPSGPQDIIGFTGPGGRRAPRDQGASVRWYTGDYMDGYLKNPPGNSWPPIYEEPFGPRFDRSPIPSPALFLGKPIGPPPGDGLRCFLEGMTLNLMADAVQQVCCAGPGRLPDILIERAIARRRP